MQSTGLPSCDIETENAMIISAIKKYGSEALIEDKTLDLVAAIVYRKLRHTIVADTDDEERSSKDKSEKSSALWVLDLIVGLLGLVVCGIIIWTYFVGNKQVQPGMQQQQTVEQGQSGGNLMQKPDKMVDKMKDGTQIRYTGRGSAIAGPFEFKCAKDVGFESYIGRNKEFEKVSKDVIKYLDDITKHSKNELTRANAYTKQSYVLHGPAGTGKTIFVRHLAQHVDKVLKTKVAQRNDPKKFADVSKDKEALESYLDSLPSRTYVCEVAPGDINSKWHGESEKNINMLFEAANILGSKSDTAVFLFFDEGDGFFSKRESGGNDVNISLKNELLTKIGGIPDVYRGVFVFCSTNRFDVFDTAFKRRFSQQIRLGILTLEERKDFLKALLEDYNLTSEEMERLVMLTQGRTPSFITKYIKDFLVGDDSTEPDALKLKEFAEFLYENKENTDLV